MKFLVVIALVASAQALRMAIRKGAGFECPSRQDVLCSGDPAKVRDNGLMVCCPPSTKCIWDKGKINGCVNRQEYDEAERQTICPAETFWERRDRSSKPLKAEQGCRDKTCDRNGYCCDGFATNGCRCPHPDFLAKHVCDWCQNKEDALQFTWDTRGYGGGVKTNTVFTDYNELDTTVEWRGKRHYCLDTPRTPRRAFVFNYDAYNEEWVFEKQMNFKRVVHNPENGHFTPDY